MSVNRPSSPSHPPKCTNRLQWTSQTAWQWVFQTAIDARVRSRSSSTTLPPSSDGGEGVAAPIEEEEWIRAGRVSELPSFQKMQRHNTSSSSSQTTNQTKQRRTRPNTNCLLRVERDDGDLIVWFGGNAFDHLGDKDLLCELCNHPSANLDSLVPPTTLVPWDSESVEDYPLPQSPHNPNEPTPMRVVLKPPLGCQGAGIEFHHDPEEILAVVRRDAAAARKEPGFLDEIRASKGRVPSWVLQTYVPSLLLGGRKFHVRAYVLVHQFGTTTTAREEELTTPEIYYYDEFEVRIASANYDDEDYTNRAAHITNGAGGSETSRRMMEEIPELNPETVRVFLTALFSPNRILRSNVTESADGIGGVVGGQFAMATEVYALAALDIMIDTAGNAWLLEVNARCPAAPGRGLGSGMFQEHLVKFAGRLLDVAVGRGSSSSNGMEGFVLL